MTVSRGGLPHTTNARVSTPAIVSVESMTNRAFRRVCNLRWRCNRHGTEGHPQSFTAAL